MERMTSSSGFAWGSQYLRNMHAGNENTRMPSDRREFEPAVVRKQVPASGRCHFSHPCYLVVHCATALETHRVTCGGWPVKVTRASCQVGTYVQKVERRFWHVYSKHQPWSCSGLTRSTTPLTLKSTGPKLRSSVSASRLSRMRVWRSPKMLQNVLEGVAWRGVASGADDCE